VEDRLAVVAAIHHVIHGARILDSELSSHVRQRSAGLDGCQGKWNDTENRPLSDIVDQIRPRIGTDR
jgi:hypothetical protein